MLPFAQPPNKHMHCAIVGCQPAAYISPLKLSPRVQYTLEGIGKVDIRHATVSVTGDLREVLKRLLFVHRRAKPTPGAAPYVPGTFSGASHFCTSQASADMFQIMYPGESFVRPPREPWKSTMQEGSALFVLLNDSCHRLLFFTKMAVPIHDDYAWLLPHVDSLHRALEMRDGYPTIDFCKLQPRQAAAQPQPQPQPQPSQGLPMIPVDVRLPPPVQDARQQYAFSPRPGEHTDRAACANPAGVWERPAKRARPSPP